MFLRNIKKHYNRMNQSISRPKCTVSSIELTNPIDHIEDIVTTIIENETIEKETPIQPIIVQSHTPNINNHAIQKFSIENILFKSNT